MSNGEDFKYAASQADAETPITDETPETSQQWYENGILYSTNAIHSDAVYVNGVRTTEEDTYDADNLVDICVRNDTVELHSESPYLKKYDISGTGIHYSYFNCLTADQNKKCLEELLCNSKSDTLIADMHSIHSVPDDLFADLRIKHLIIYNCPNEEISVGRSIAVVEITNSRIKRIIGCPRAVAMIKCTLTTFDYHPSVKKLYFNDCKNLTHISGKNRFKRLHIYGNTVIDLHKYIYLSVETVSDLEIRSSLISANVCDVDVIDTLLRDIDYDHEQLDLQMDGRGDSLYEFHLLRKRPDCRYTFCIAYDPESHRTSFNHYLYRHNRILCDTNDRFYAAMCNVSHALSKRKITAFLALLEVMPPETAGIIFNQTFRSGLTIAQQHEITRISGYSYAKYTDRYVRDIHGHLHFYKNTDEKPIITPVQQ